MKFSKFIGKFFVALVVPSLMVSSCALLGLEEEEDETETASASASIPELAGTWSTSCFDASGGGGFYGIISLTHSGSTTDFQFALYSDSSCSTAYYHSNEVSNSVTKGTETTLVDGTTGYTLSAKLTSSTYTPDSATAANAMNADPSSWCGLTGWTSGTAKSIVGTSCTSKVVGGDVNAAYSVSGTSLKIDGSSSVTVLTKQ